MNNPITSTETEVVIKKISQKTKAQDPDGCTGEFCQTFREKLRPILLKLFQKIAEEGTLPNSFRKAIHHPDRDKTKKENLGQYH